MSKLKTQTNKGAVTRFKPKTKKQLQLADSIIANKIVFATGPAGTGKTHVPVALACEDFIDGKISKIILVRPAVVACGEKLGYLPGDILDKMDPFLAPIFDVMNEYWQDAEIERMYAAGTIEISPLSFMRGRTFRDCYVLTDEAQNMTEDQMIMLLTRVGLNGKLVIGGDLEQNDLGKVNSGLAKGIKLANLIHGIDHVQFDLTDIVRDPIIKEILEVWKTL